MVQVTVLVNLVELNVEINTLNFGPSFSMIARTSYFVVFGFVDTTIFQSTKERFKFGEKILEIVKVFRIQVVYFYFKQMAPHFILIYK